MKGLKSSTTGSSTNTVRDALSVAIGKRRPDYFDEFNFEFARVSPISPTRQAQMDAFRQDVLECAGLAPLSPISPARQAPMDAFMQDVLACADLTPVSPISPARQAQMDAFMQDVLDCADLAPTDRHSRPSVELN